MFSSHTRSFQKGLDLEKCRRSRYDQNLALRKKTRQERLQKRRRALKSSDAHPIYKNCDISIFVSQLKSSDQETRLNGASMIRQLLSIEKNPPIEQVFNSGIVPKMISFLDPNNSSISDPLRLEAAWSITNLASSDTVFCHKIVDYGGLIAFNRILRQSTSLDVINQVIWGIGNIVGDSQKFRNIILEMNFVEYVVSKFFDYDIATQATLMWCISNICRADKKYPNDKNSLEKHWNHIKCFFPLINKILETFENSIKTNNNAFVSEIFYDLCWCVSYLTEEPSIGDIGSNQAYIQCKLLCDIGITNKIMNVAKYHVNCYNVFFKNNQNRPNIDLREKAIDLLNVKLCQPCMRSLGTIVTLNDDFTQYCLDNGLLDIIYPILMMPPCGQIQRETVWIVSNITAGTQEQIELILKYNKGCIINQIINLLESGIYQVKKEAAWCISNGLSGGSSVQKKQFIEMGAIKGLCNLLDHVNNNIGIIQMILEGLSCAFDIFFNGNGANGFNPYLDQFETYQGIDKLEYLQTSDKIDNLTYERIGNFIKKYFPPDHDQFTLENDAIIINDNINNNLNFNAQMLEPKLNEKQFVFGFVGNNNNNQMSMSNNGNNQNKMGGSGKKIWNF